MASQTIKVWGTDALIGCLISQRRR